MAPNPLTTPNLTTTASVGRYVRFATPRRNDRYLAHAAVARSFGVLVAIFKVVASVLDK
jgi:hypothetical protein